AALAAGLTLARDRAGLAFTLAVPILPLGNISMGLALAYLLAAGAWLALMWGEPRRGLLFAARPLLAPVGMVGLLPLVALCLKSPPRRAVAAGGGVLTAVAGAGVPRASLPLAYQPQASPRPLGATDSPREAASVILSTLQAHPVTLVAAAIAALAAAALPIAVRRGYAGIAGYGVAVVAVSIAAGVGMAVVQVVCATGLTCVA